MTNFISIFYDFMTTNLTLLILYFSKDFQDLISVIKTIWPLSFIVLLLSAGVYIFLEIWDIYLTSR